MKNTYEDNELRQLLKNFQLEKPSSDFTSSVMNRVQQEHILVEQVKHESLFGKMFWSIVALFIVILVAAFLLQENSTATWLDTFMNEAGNLTVKTRFDLLLYRISNIPVYVAGIFTALSFLAFIDRLISLKNPDMV